MTKISDKALIDNGWEKKGNSLYSKGDYFIGEDRRKFGILTYNGTVGKTDIISTIEELNDKACQYYEERIKFLEESLKDAKENLKKFKEYE